MSENKLNIRLQFQNKEELEEIVRKVGAEHNFPVDVDLSQVRKGVEGLTKSLETPIDKFKSLASSAGIAIFGVKQIYSVLDKTLGGFVRAAQDADTAMAQVQAAFRATGLEAEQGAIQVDDFANRMQALTVYDDESIKYAMAKMQNMARFETGKMLEEATKAAIGLAAAFQLDLSTAMDLVSKAAAGNTALLGRYGIILDDAATQAEKFSQVLAIGAGYFGVAEAQAKSAFGTIEQLKNAWGDLQEVLAEGIVPVLTNLATVLKGVIDAISSVSMEHVAITAGLLVLNALVIKNAVAVMAQRAAWAALTVEQKRQVATLLMLTNAQKGASIWTMSFGAAMQTLGQRAVAAGAAVKGFLASIGPLGWTIAGVTAAYLTLNAVLKVNTGAMKDQIEAEKEALELKKKRIEKKQQEERETLKLTARYRELAQVNQRNNDQQRELAGLHRTLSDRFPSLIKHTDSYSNSLKGVERAANQSRSSLKSLGGQLDDIEKKMARLSIDSQRLDVYDALQKEFNWRDVFSFTSHRLKALDEVKADMQTLLRDQSNVSDEVYRRIIRNFNRLAKDASAFYGSEQAALKKAANGLENLLMMRQEYNSMISGGAKKEAGAAAGGGGGVDPKQAERDRWREKVEEYRTGRDMGFDPERTDAALMRQDYAKARALFVGNALILKDLAEMEEREVAEIRRRYREAGLQEEEKLFEKLKFYHEGYYAWKKAQIEKEAEETGASGVWVAEQVRQLNQEREEWERRDLIAFEDAYSEEMSHLAELRDLGLATYSEIASKAWEYYEALQAIVAADGVISEEEQGLLDVYRKRAQAAQLAVNRDSDVARYYEEVKFHDSGYYEWKKERIEEDVGLMKLSDEQKAIIMRERLEALKQEMEGFRVDRSFSERIMDFLGIPEGVQAQIISTYQTVARQISSIWSQLHANLSSQKDYALRGIEERAKKERKTDVWLAAEKERIDADYEKKHRQMKRAEQKMQISSATMNTLEAITNALTVKPAWLATAQAALVGGLGFAQVKLIAEQKLWRGGLVEGKGTETSDSNIVALSNNEFVIRASRVRELGVPFLEALNDGKFNVSKAVPSFNAQPARTAVGPQKVVLMCDGRELARAVTRGNRRIRST